MANYGIEIEDVDGDIIATTDKYSRFAYEFGTVKGMDSGTIELTSGTLSGLDLGGFLTYTSISGQWYAMNTSRDRYSSKYFLNGEFQHYQGNSVSNPLLTYSSQITATCLTACSFHQFRLGQFGNSAYYEYFGCFEKDKLYFGSIDTGTGGKAIQSVAGGNNGTTDYTIWAFDRPRSGGYSSGTNYTFSSEKALSITQPAGYAGGFEIWARPQSSSYTGQFCLYKTFDTSYIGGFLSVSSNRLPPAPGQVPNPSTSDVPSFYFSILDFTGGNNTFEIALVQSGHIIGTYLAADSSGSTNYGVELYSASSIEFVTKTSITGGNISYCSTEAANFSTKARPARMLLQKGIPASSVSFGTTTNFTLGTLPTSSTKRWCRLSDTIFNKRGGFGNSATEYRMTYNWTSNNSISLRWQSIGSALGSPFSLFQDDEYAYDKFFAVAEFGDGV